MTMTTTRGGSVIADVDRMALQYRALLAVTNVLNSQRSTPSLYQAITEQVKAVIPWARAGITLFDPESQTFHFYQVETQLPKVVLHPDASIPKQGSAVGWVYEHRRPHVRPDLQRTRVFLEDEWYAQEGLGRMINLPLLVHDHCIGTLNIGSVEAGDPSPGDLDFLLQVASQIAFAIDHVRAYDQINRLREQLARENLYLAEQLKQTLNFGVILGASRAIRDVLALAQEVAPTTAAVLVTGETGTGKELLAQAIHDASPRRAKPFVRINCAAMPAGLVESELFGHERGAFSGADQRKAGRFELADGGTLFLDEVGELPLEAQAKLLRVLQDGVVDRVGGTKPLKVDVRIVAATNANLPALIAQRQFRSDLFYRLNVFPITIPPLRQRPEDIPILVGHFLRLFGNKLKRPPLEMEPASLQRLIRYDWPGNVRELQNVIERACILTRTSPVTIEEGVFGPAPSPDRPDSATRLDSVERAHLCRVLAECQWKIEGRDGAAARLGLLPSTLRSRLKKHRIQRPSQP